MGDEAKARLRARPIMGRQKGLYIRLAPGERALLIAAAEVSSMTATSWIRHHALRAAAGVSQPPGPFQALAARHSPGKLIHAATSNFTAEEYEAIVAHACTCGLTVAALIRKLVLGYEPMVRQPRVRSAIAAVHRAGDTLRRLLHLAGTGAPLAPDLVSAIAHLRDEIHALRDALLRADATGAPDATE